MKNVATVRAQAKLNVWLHVLARENSGYHSIETLFHRIDLADDITVTVAPPRAISVECSVDVGPQESNIAYHAAQLYCNAVGWESGFHIDIVKRIPVGGGLGGGSADAAATLRAMNALRAEPLPEHVILMLAARLGADVAFLATTAPMALAWARGDHMLELPALPQRHVALLVPDFSVSTGDAYRWVAELRGDSPFPPRVLSRADLMAWPRGIAPNDFTVPVSRNAGIRSVLHAIRALQNAGASLAGMTGSGSTLFGIFDAPADAELLGRETGCRVILTQSASAVEAVSCSN